jgi:exosome complex RNA-binding protein Rrp42 (RNase PH superfamily)
MLSDPTGDEADISNAKCTIMMDQQGNLCGQYKMGGVAIDLPLIKDATRKCYSRVQELQLLLNKG